MEMYKFIKESSSEHLTIADVKKLKPGDKLDVVIWDRNFEEHWIWDEAESEKLYNAEKFFKYNRANITYLGHMRWELHLNYGDFKHPIHLDISNLETKRTWVTIDEKDGCVHLTNEIVKQGCVPTHLHWSEFHETTRVGWRGPIMLWDKLKDMSQVYNKNGCYE
jgi:hypothetical protein